MQARGSAIRRRREESGCGLTAFAVLVGISPGYLSRIENGKANPSPDVLRRIALELRRRRRVRAAIQEIAPQEGEERAHGRETDRRIPAGAAVADSG